MNDSMCNIMNSSTTIGESGARSHSILGDSTPVDNTITMFILSIQLIECYTVNCIGSLTVNILFVYIYRVINDLWHLL
jgi:hypothetical protein